MWVHQDCWAESSFFSPPLSESSWKADYLNVEVYEENDQCGHIGGLEHEAAKRESTWLHSCAERVHNSEQKLELWRKDRARVFAEKGLVLAKSNITKSPSPALWKFEYSWKLSLSEPVTVLRGWKWHSYETEKTLRGQISKNTSLWA